MNCSLRKILFSFILFSGVVYAPGNPENHSSKAYNDTFGPLASNYSMGDFVRYTVTPGSRTTITPGTGSGYNVYYGITQIPYASDIYNYGLNSYNLYNSLGYLFAGYAALNINPAPFTTSYWLTSMRQATQITDNGITASLFFDNNPGVPHGGHGKEFFPNDNKNAIATIQLVDYSKTNPEAYSKLAFGCYVDKVLIDQGQFFLNANFSKHKINHSHTASSSCAWSTNWTDGHYVLAIGKNKNNTAFWDNIKDIGDGCAAPYGQFFGARLAHILGSVVNDVPPSTGATVGSLASLGLMQTATPMPLLAIMNGNTAGYTLPNKVPKGSVMPSRAHFGTMSRFLTNLSANASRAAQASTGYQYLINHILPAVQRLSKVCSYAMSSSVTPTLNNLIEIQSSKVTGYDNGVIVDVQNNTGDSLRINQIIGSRSNFIGTLKGGGNNYFLHTASLMNASAGSSGSTASSATPGAPVIGNVIEIADQEAQASAFIQVVNGVQLQNIVNSLNKALNASENQTGYNFAYNQVLTYQPATSLEYLLVTNFNPSTFSSANAQSNQVLMCRMQAINVAAFNGKPYFVTLKIDKENVGYGLEKNKIDAGDTGTLMLYPSIVSVKTMQWQNLYDKARGSGYYSSIPLLLISDSILNSTLLTGLQAHYGIWLMSYAAALTEFQFGCQFGNNFNCLQNTFGLFDTVSQSVPARAVIDTSGILQSGQSLIIENPAKETIQSNAGYLALMGCDVWDLGQNFHQDIPILQFYQDLNGNTVANLAGGSVVNLAVKVKVEQSLDAVTTFDQAYGQPYNQVMLYGLQTTDLQAGVTGQFSQPSAGHYQLVFADAQNNVLAFQKIVTDDLSSPESMMSINFLNSNDALWKDRVVIPRIVTSVAVGQTKTFTLKYTVAASGKNKLVIDGLVINKKIASVKPVKKTKKLE
jgi:hypothetical protein